MAVYEENVTSVVENIKASDASDFVKSAVEHFLTDIKDITSVKVAQFEGTPLPDAKIVDVPSNVTLNIDPGAPIIIMNSSAPGANVRLDAFHSERVVVGSSNGDKIIFAGDRNVTVETGGGNDSIITASGADVVVVKGDGAVTVGTAAGDDVVRVDQTAEGSVTINAGDGFDRVEISGDRTSHTIDIQNGKVVVMNSDVTVETSGVEVIKYDDGHISVVANNETEAFIARLYEVVFDREADLSGLRWWFDNKAPLVENGELTLKDIVKDFMHSSEYQYMYARTDNEAFLANLYDGMADRLPDDAGKAFWLNELDHDASRADVIYGFATSDEAIQVVGVDGSKYVIDLSADISQG